MAAIQQTRRFQIRGGYRTMTFIQHNFRAYGVTTFLVLMAGIVFFTGSFSNVSGAANGRSPQFGETAMDKKYTETESANLKKVNDGFEAWKKGTGSPYQLLDDNVSWTIVGNSLASKEYKSRKAFIDEVITPFNARMSKPLVPTIRNIYADGDTVIVFFDAEGTAKDGKTYKNTYSWFLRLKDGRIDRAVAFFDSIHFNDFWTRVPGTKE